MEVLKYKNNLKNILESNFGILNFNFLKIIYRNKDQIRQ